MKLIKYLKPYWYLALLTPLTMIGEVLIDLALPKMMSKIVDQGVLAYNMELIIRTGCLMIVLVLTGGIFGVGSAALSGATSHSFACDLRNDVFSRTMDLSFQQTDKFTTGSLVTRMTNDITQVQQFVDLALRLFVRSFMMFAGGIIMMLTLNVNYGFVLICALPLELIIMFFLLKKASPIFGLVQKKLDKVNSVVQENITGARVVKACVREKFEENRFGKANHDLTETNLSVQKIMAVLNPLLMIVLHASIVAIILIGGKQVEARSMQVGGVMAAVTYITQILMSIMMVSMMFQQISRAKASAERLYEVLETHPAIEGGTYRTDTLGDICFHNVSFHYPGFSGRNVLKNLNLHIRQGENIAVLGATGAGKTSLVHLIPRFYDAAQGSITIGGVDVKEFDLDCLRSKIGIVMQKTELFSGTVSENIRWGNEHAAEEDIKSAASIAQADEFISEMSGAYEGYIAEKGASLSGGQKQRLSVARSIIKKPQILIFDDSTSALDLSTEAKLRAELNSRLKGTTMITIAQRIASVMNCDRIAVIEDGQLSACGTHEELLQSSEVYRDIYESQMKKGDAVHV